MGPLFNLLKYKITLVSVSPRRRQLLQAMGIEFRVSRIDLEESVPEGLSPEEAALCLAQHKATTYSSAGISEDQMIITADTVVCLGGRILGKPRDRGEAVAMLNELSGRKHEVITGVCIMTARKEASFTDSTIVHFRNLTKEEINFYIDNFKPYDKAGSYGIQEWIGYIGIDHIEGSFHNVMGLPTQKLYNELKQF